MTDEAAADLPGAFERFRQTLREPTVPENVVPTLLTTSFTLCGLRHDATLIRELYRSLSNILEDSTTYQWIISQGFAKGESAGFTKGESEGKAQEKAEEARALLLPQGQKRFGEPTAGQHEALTRVSDLAQLERLALRLLDAGSWEELLTSP